MSSAQGRSPAVAPRADELPLRSLTAVWVAVGVFSLAIVGLAGRSLWASSASSAAASPIAVTQGPSKRQVRERQEHIALTERALDLARKERSAAANGAPPTSGGSSADAAAPPAAAPPAAAPSAAEKPAAAKPAAGGLDAMRADIAAQFE